MDYVTTEIAREWGACYDDSKLEEILGEGRDILEILDLRRLKHDISLSDRIWTAARPQVLGDKDCRLFACWCAKGALLVTGHDDQRSHHAIDIASRFAFGQVTEEALVSASADAYDSYTRAYATYSRAAAAHAAHAAVAHAHAIDAYTFCFDASVYAAHAAANAAAYADIAAANAAKKTQIRKLASLIRSGGFGHWSAWQGAIGGLTKHHGGEPKKRL